QKLSAGLKPDCCRGLPKKCDGFECTNRKPSHIMAAWNSTAEDDAREFVRGAQHGIVAGVDYVPAGLKLVSGATDVRLARIGSTAAIKHVGIPLLIPEPRKIHGLA